ncbi:MAG: hypothetical protein ACRDGQ_06250 [Candidatus Limnocylindrales bacterium]
MDPGLATPQSIATGQDVCRYDTATDGEGMTVTVYQPSSGVTFEMMDSVLRTVGTTTSVSGVGDKAEKNSIELVAQVGDRLIDVNGAGSTSGDSTSKDAAIANAVIAALP